MNTCTSLAHSSPTFPSLASVLYHELEHSNIEGYKSNSEDYGTEVKITFPEYSFKERIAIGALVFWIGIVPQDAIGKQFHEKTVSEKEMLVNIENQINNTLTSIIKDAKKVTSFDRFSIENLIDVEEINSEMEIISDYMETMRPYVKSQKKKIILYS